MTATTRRVVSNSGSRMEAAIRHSCGQTRSDAVIVAFSIPLTCENALDQVFCWPERSVRIEGVQGINSGARYQEVAGRRPDCRKRRTGLSIGCQRDRARSRGRRRGGQSWSGSSEKGEGGGRWKTTGQAIWHGPGPAGVFALADVQLPETAQTYLISARSR